MERCLLCLLQQVVNIFRCKKMAHFLHPSIFSLSPSELEWLMLFRFSQQTLISICLKMRIRLLFLLLVSICGLNGQYNVYRHDPFALLSATLKTYQEAACDGQELNLQCPQGTKISIQLVQYGRSAPSDQVNCF